MIHRFVVCTFLFLSFFVECNAQAKAQWKNSGHIEKGDKIISLAGNLLKYQSAEGKTISKKMHFDSGQITHYKEWWEEDTDISHGVFKEWYDSGELWRTGQYARGKEVGQWKEFDKQRRITEVTVYRKSINYGYRNRYDLDSGHLSRYTPLVSGVIDGDVLTFNTTGDTTAVCQYSLGNLVSCNNDSLTVTNPSISVDQLPYLFLDECEVLNYPEVEKCSLGYMYAAIFSVLVYPRKDQEAKVQGTVMVSFIVERDGELTNFDVLRGISDGMTKAALDAIKSLSKWKPGIRGGEPVRMRYLLPIRFKLGL